MSNSTSSKPGPYANPKRLKGGVVSNNLGSFDTINASSLKLETLNVAGVFEDGIFLNVIIQDSEIRNSIIGADGSNSAYFSTLVTRQGVTFGSNIGESVTWNPDTGLFYITSDLKVDGCSYLGNIEICRNDIQATNTDGDINLKPKGFGRLNVSAPVQIISSTGSFYSELNSGGNTFISNTDFSVYSSHGNLNVTTFGPQTFKSDNGDITISTDNGVSTTQITSILSTAGSIFINTTSANKLLPGDVITISNNSTSFNGSFTVGSIISDFRFRVTTTSLSTVLATGGSYLRTPDSSIVLSSQTYVKIPDSTKLTFGATCNAIYANSAGLLINSCNDIQFNLPSTNNVQFPLYTNVQFGTAASVSLTASNGNLNLTHTDGTLTISNVATQIESTNVRFYDPILTLADYSQSTNDFKDRGVEFYYNDSTSGSRKLGWFGYKNTSGRFTFLTDAVNNNEVISGSIGSLELTNLTLDNIYLVEGGVINANCGRILGVSLITGCGGQVTIQGTENITLSANSRIALNSSTDILVPNNIPVLFGTNGTRILENTASNLVLTASKNVAFLTQSGGSVILPVETNLSFSGTSSGSSIVSNTSGDLNLQSSRDIRLTTTTGNIIVPTTTQIQFGSSSQNISGTTSGLTLVSNSTTGTIQLISSSDISLSNSFGNVVIQPNIGDIFLQPTIGDIRIPQTRNLIFSTSGSGNSLSLASNGNFQITGTGNNIDINNWTNINLAASENVNIPTNVKLSFGTAGYIVSDPSNISFVNDKTSGSITLSSNTTQLSNTNGTLIILNNNTFISSGNFIVSAGNTLLESDNVKIKDPILTLANYTTVDNKDRGIEYNYTNSSGSTQLGWFGYKTTTGRLSYYSDAINTDGVISGTIGDFEISSLYLQKSIVFQTRGNTIDMNCGTLLNANTITGCSDVLNLNGSGSVNINATNVNINATQSVQLPAGIPLAFGTTSSSITGDSSGRLFVNSDTVVFNSNVQINGTTTNIYSTVTNLEDPIFSLGGVIGPTINDLKDRGIEFKWNSTGTGSKVGFFGYKNSLGRFVFIQDGTNNNEVFTGPFGDVQFGNGYFSNIFLDNGTISGINTLSGGTINIVTTSGNINLTPTNGSSILLPYNTPFAFGTTSNSFNVDTSGNLIQTFNGSISLTSYSGGISFNTTNEIRFPNDTPLYFGTNNSTSIISSGGNLILSNSSGDINLNPATSTGSINIPSGSFLNFGSTENSIVSDNGQLYINGYNGVSISSSTITFAGNVNIIGSINAGAISFDLDTYILPLGTSQKLNITSIVSLPSTTVSLSGTNGNTLIKTGTIHYLTEGDIVTISNSDSVPVVDGDYVVRSIVSSTEFTIQSLTTLTSSGTTGSIKGVLKFDQNKDVGIQVNYWNDLTGNGITVGSTNYHTGFFGFKDNTLRWTFYKDATISNSVVSGQLGDIEVNKVFASKIGDFILDGGITAGNNKISGTNFDINGGVINTTPIGQTTAAPGRFSNLASTVTTNINNVTVSGSLNYAFERFTLNSVSPTRNPNAGVITSFVSVSSVSFTATGTMPSTGLTDGQIKVIVISNMVANSKYVLQFAPNTLVTPNPPNNTGSPTKMTFQRSGQSIQMIWDATLGAWIPIGTGVYIS